MALLKVFWTETSLKQRDQIFEYWNKQNQSTGYSKRLRIKINRNIQILKKYPYAGKITDCKPVRTLVWGHFSLLYKFDDKQIIIVAFWDNRQDPEKLLTILQQK